MQSKKVNLSKVPGVDSTNGEGSSVAFIVGFIRDRSAGIQTPLRSQRLGFFSGRREFEVADLPGDNGALGLGLQSRDELGLQSACLLRVQVACLLRDIDERVNFLIVTFFGSLFGGASSSADLDGELFARGITNKLSGTLLDVASGAGGFIKSTTLLGSLSVAHLLQWPVALFHSFSGGLLLEGDLTLLLKVLLANFFLSGFEFGDVGVVTLLLAFMNALKNGVLENK